MIIINAPCAFIRIEIRRRDDREDTVIAEVLPAEALREFFGVKGPSEWIRKLQENRYDLRRLDANFSTHQYNRTSDNNSIADLGWFVRTW